MIRLARPIDTFKDRDLTRCPPANCPGCVEASTGNVVDRLVDNQLSCTFQACRVLTRVNAVHRRTECRKTDTDRKTQFYVIYLQSGQSETSSEIGDIAGPVFRAQLIGERLCGLEVERSFVDCPSRDSACYAFRFYFA